MHALHYINLIARAKGEHPLWPHYLWLNPQRTGVFYKRKGGGGGPLWSPRLSRLVVMERGCFFQGTNIL